MAERAVARIGLEIERAGFEPVAHPNSLDRAAKAGEAFRHADRLQHPVRRAGDRRGTTVEASGEDHCRIGDINDDRAESVRVERNRERAADKAAAQDDHIGLIHASALGSIVDHRNGRDGADLARGQEQGASDGFASCPQAPFGARSRPEPNGARLDVGVRKADDSGA